MFFKGCLVVVLVLDVDVWGWCARSKMLVVEVIFVVACDDG